MASIADESYAAHRGRLTAASLTPAAAAVFLATLVYAIADSIRDPASVHATWPEYLAELLIPVITVWLVRRPLQHHPEAVALGFDMAFTASLALMLLQPTTTTSGSALFFSLKMLATALFLPWSARLQYVSAAVTLALYGSVLLATGRALEPGPALHQILGPLIAAVFSVAGATAADRQREGLFRRGVELAASEARIRAQQREQQVIFDSVPAYIWYKDTNNQIVRVNQPAADSMGLPVAAIEGRSTYELYPDEASKYHQDDLEVVRSGREKRGIIEPMQTASGEKRWVQTDKIPYRDERGDIVGVIVFAVDITERRRA